MSESAASWAAELPALLVGRGEVEFQLLLNLVSARRISVLPHWKSCSRWLMICLMLLFLGLSAFGVGASMSISRWNRSHQNASESLVEQEVMTHEMSLDNM